MANDFLTLIKTRRSIRAYKPDAVPADVLARVLEAGTYAPSAMGKQSATIVAVTTQAYRDRLTKLNAAVIGKNVDPYYGAPVIVVVLGDGESANYLADGSCVLENLMLAAHAEGLGTVWVNREREIFDSPQSFSRQGMMIAICSLKVSSRRLLEILPVMKRKRSLWV